MTLQSLKSRQDIIKFKRQTRVAPWLSGTGTFTSRRPIVNSMTQLISLTKLCPFPPALYHDQKIILKNIKVHRQFHQKRPTERPTEQPTCYLYLGKVHKIHTPGRPGHSLCLHWGALLKIFLNYSLLLPIVQSLHTYVKDTTHAHLWADERSKFAMRHQKNPGRAQ